MYTIRGITTKLAARAMAIKEQLPSWVAPAILSAVLTFAVSYSLGNLSEGSVESKQTMQKLAIMDTKLEMLTGQMAMVQKALGLIDQTNSIVAVLQVRIDTTEKMVERHDEVLNQLRAYRVPQTVR